MTSSELMKVMCLCCHNPKAAAHLVLDVPGRCLEVRSMDILVLADVVVDHFWWWRHWQRQGGGGDVLCDVMCNLAPWVDEKREKTNRLFFVISFC